MRQHISQDKKLLLEAVIELGISGNFAAQILGVTSSSRLMRNLQINKAERKAMVEQMTTEDRRLQEATDNEDKKKA